MNAEPAFEPERVVAALNEDGVRYVLVGGLAVGAHGVVRATRDLDMVPAPEDENMDRLAACLTRLGGEHQISGSLTASGLAAPVNFKIRTRHGDVQVLNRMHGVPAFSELDADRILVEIGPAVTAPMCSLVHLRWMKAAANRPRDRVDLAELEALHGR